MDKKISAVVFLTVFLDLVGFGILIPIQPFFALSFSASPSLITLLSASYSLMQFLFMPLWGKISDRFGRRPVMLVSIATSALGFFIFACADSLLMLFISRMISGFGGANISCAQAIIADISDEKERTEGMGLVGAAMGLGFIVGPALGGSLGGQGFMLPALIAGVLSLLNLLLAALLLKETRWRKDIQVSKAPLTLSMETKRNLPALYALSLLFIMAFALFEQAIGIYLNAHITSDNQPDLPYYQSVKFTAFYLVVVALVAAITQISILKPFATRFGEKRMLTIGTFLAAFSLLALPVFSYAKNVGYLIFPGAFFAIGLGISMPCISSLISKSVTSENQGATLGTSQSFSALGRVVGPALCGILFEQSIHAPFFLAGLISFACFFITLTLTP